MEKQGLNNIEWSILLQTLNNANREQLTRIANGCHRRIKKIDVLTLEKFEREQKANKRK